jgi:hypothetical protein
VDVGEGVRVDPLVFRIVNFEREIGWDASCVRSLPKEDRKRGRREYNSGWIGLRSLPMTCALGYVSAGDGQQLLILELGMVPNSMAQIPVPVPKSSTFLRVSTFKGARCNRSWSAILHKWCWRSDTGQFQEVDGQGMEGASPRRFCSNFGLELN